MICSSCAQAGDIRREDPALATNLHLECDGDTRCDCQHVVVGEWLRFEHNQEDS